MSSTCEFDDLDSRPSENRNATRAIRAQRAQSFSSASITSGTLDTNRYSDGDPPRKKVKLGKEVWLDENGEEVGAAASKKFKERGAKRRKQAIASTKRAKAIDAENHPAPHKTGGGHTGVGRQSSKKKKNPKHKSDVHNDIPSDEEGMDHTMPDYVQQRRSNFNERSERLREAGLLLPPSYDEIYFSDNERIQNLQERPDLPEVTPPASYEDIELPYSLGTIPAPIAQYLRDYQVKGAAFLHELFVYQKGGILGDDMGLGKTIQVIAFLTAAYGKTADERDRKRMRKMRRAGSFYPRTLIICPGSLMANWEDELKRWGWWHTDRFHNSSKQREESLAQARAGMLEIMMTTYDTYRLYASEINTICWDCVITDECHIFKKRGTETTKAMNQVNALCRIGLTGTVIQNNYEELWTLLNWSSPGRLGPISTWKVTISEPLKIGQSYNATYDAIDRGRTTAEQLVQNLLPHFFLRRMKSLIKDQLPKKSDRVVFCPLEPDQVDAYQNFLDSEYVRLIKGASELCPCQSGKKSGHCCNTHLENGDKWQAWFFPCITYLQRLSNHLALVIPSSGDNLDKQAKDTELLQAAMPNQWTELIENRDSIINHHKAGYCGKWRVLKKLLKFWHESGNNKVLVFSHSVRLLKMLQALFMHTSYNTKYLDGSMSYDDRYAAVVDFNTDPTQFVFLISTKAGGVGLNITSANKVVIVDPNWNPSHDLQAQDRAYRIGQRKDVEVFRLISQGTMEEIIYARQIYKQQMSNIALSASSERRYFTGVQNRKDQKGEIFGLANLFAYQNENVVLRDIVHKTNVAESKADLQIAELDLDDPELEQDGSECESKDDDDLLQSATTMKSKNSSVNEDEYLDPSILKLAADVLKDSKPSRLGRDSASDAALATSFDVFSSVSGNNNKKKERHNPIQAILASAGVTYTHENSEVIGSSRVEAKLSKHAKEADTQTRSSRAFVNESQSQAQAQRQLTPDYTAVKYRFRPPKDVKQRQFCSMARWAGFEKDEEVVEFALVVESWTQAERRDVLDRFYRWRRDCLINGTGNMGSDEGLEHGRNHSIYDEKEIEEEEGSERVKIKIENKRIANTNERSNRGRPKHELVLISDDDGDDEL